MYTKNPNQDCHSTINTSITNTFKDCDICDKYNYNHKPCNCAKTNPPSISQGPTGPMGPQGSAGPTGPTGPTGLSRPEITPYIEIYLDNMAIDPLNPTISNIMLSTTPYTIPFDTIAPGATLNLGYTADNGGVFTIQPGSYGINYWINVSGVTNETIINQAIELDVVVNGVIQSKSLVTYAGAGAVSSQTSYASTIVNVTSPNTTIALTFPVQNGGFRFSSSIPQASISFTKLA